MSTAENTKLCDFTSTNNDDFICTPIAPPAAKTDFYEIKPALLNLVMKEQFSGASTDDAAAHLNNFVELCEMQKYKDMDGDIIKLKLFPFSLRGRAKEWLLSLPRNSIDSWTKCKDAFIGKYYPPAKIISLRSSIMNFKQMDNEHVAQAWERMKSLIKNCPTHGLTAWMIIQTFYAGLNFSSRNLLDSAAGGTFMSITLGAATKLLDDMMVNYSEWHTERAPQGKKVNSVEETSSLSEKIDVIMSMLVNGKSFVDPNNVPLASLVAQEEHVGVNFIKNNNFNNNAYRNNFGNNNYKPYPPNNNYGYGNSYGNSYGKPRLPSEERLLEVERTTKDYMQAQYEQNQLFTKTMNEQSALLKNIGHQLENLNKEIFGLQTKISNAEDRISSMSESQASLINKMAAKPEVIEHNIFATANAIQVRIDDNVRMLAELHARWEREREATKKNNMVKVYTITTTSNVQVSHDNKSINDNGKVINVGNVSTSHEKRLKLPKDTKTASDKGAEIFRTMGDPSSITFDDNDFDFDNCNISEVIMLLQKLAKIPNASGIRMAFTKHITNALMKIREEKLKLEASIPKKLEDGWEPIIKLKVNDFDCNALCDLGASVSIMPKKFYDMLDLPPLESCCLNIHLADNSTKTPLGRLDDIHVMVNNNLVPIDFIVLDIECKASCPIILGRPFLRTIGAVIDMKEGNIRYQFPLKKGMEHFPRKRMKSPFDSIVRANYRFDASSLGNT